ncbi:diacylglycerol/lipid kinase family protein [Saccharopolyspora spinosa]|uniref:YegS/Rv2252/BmrU family lipid kinase n=1 Tax=Saccharopolyspora spinosa TaxID=60894 RepID=A0A2N3Y2D2_SACSN|nr:YegS/Rv2252/BmrU family lipid kinase [Saccharopolyspora spinosa]PKW17079.1 YegS/Rv2252/BmrU family lipid kinase [Saccharopolyspora spinosa]
MVNARARTGSKAYLRAIEKLRGLSVPLHSTFPLHDPARLPETVNAAVDAGHDLIILGGGDGSVSSVVDVLAHRGVPMGLLPLGTANDFARTLHIPTNLDEACRTIAHGRIVDIDLGRCGNNYYVNRASVGLGAGVAEAMSPKLKKWTGALAYPVATIKALLRHQRFSARLTFPDGDHEPQEHHGLLQLSIANGRYFGGGQLAAHDAGIDDATLDISVMRHGSVHDLVIAARDLKRGALDSDHIHHLRTARVDVVTEPDLPINVDGELVDATPQRFSVARNALHVMVPRTWTDASSPDF